ncbi:MAG TPA: hypothetical protein DEO39_03290, partial [Clostridiales bacterium]|nr:hypothetical protein [Clostridiales bacterium]
EIGASSRDIRAVREITVTSSRPEVEVPDYTAKAPQYYNLDVQTKIFDKKQFEEVYGKPIEDEKAPGKGEFTLNSALEDLRNGNLKSKLFYRSVMHGIKKKNKKETQEHLRRMNIVMTREMPLRTVASFSMGKITIEQMDALVMMFNGHFFKGLMRWRKAKKRKKDLSFL